MMVPGVAPITVLEVARALEAESHIAMLEVVPS
jgi:hypothetical protein